MEDAGVTPQEDLARSLATPRRDVRGRASRIEAGVPYQDYVRRVAESGNAAAILVKLSDLTQNMNLARLPQAGPQDVERVRRKYLPAMQTLLAAL